MPTKNKKSIEHEAILEARKVRKFMEDDLKKRLSENFSNDLKELINNQVLELDDEDNDSGDFMSEEEGSDEETVDDEEYDVDVEAPVETDDEAPSDDEEAILQDLESDLDESSENDYEDVDEETDTTNDNSLIEDLERELEDLLGGSEEVSESTEVNEETDDEKENLDEDAYESNPENNAHHVKKEAGNKNESEDTDDEDKESIDEDSYENNPENNAHHVKKESKDKDSSMVAENRKLKNQLSKIYKELSEVTLDSARERELRRLSESYELSNKAKLSVVDHLDRAKNEKELKEISKLVESIISTSGARSRKKSKVNESTKRNKAGFNSSIRKNKGSGKKTSVNESVKPEWAKRMIDISKGY